MAETAEQNPLPVGKTQEEDDISELDLSDLEQDLDFDLSGFDEIDEAETKLDLAAAYIDMDDAEGAKGILQEVLSEGSDEQKHRAQALLDTIS
ncbi:FimV/HubP family polar landmark protein [Methylophaga frappieri]